MLFIDIRSTNASAAEFILYRLKLYMHLAGRHHHHHHGKNWLWDQQKAEIGLGINLLVTIVTHCDWTHK